MPNKLDFKKQDKDLYAPGKAPELIAVPPMTFTIKMSKMGAYQPEGYTDYVLPPLEGFWWSEGRALDWHAPRESWLWTSVIRQPDFVTQETFDWAREECRRKKPEVDVESVRRIVYEEGLCVQMLHVGPYAGEAVTLARMDAFIVDNGLVSELGDVRKHHEIYMGDPRKTAPERLKTILRHPVRQK